MGKMHPVVTPEVLLNPYRVSPKAYLMGCNLKIFEQVVFLVSADRVHISIHWILGKSLALTPVPNYDMPQTLYCDHFDQWFVTKKARTSVLNNGHNQAAAIRLPNCPGQSLFGSGNRSKLAPILSLKLQTSNIIS